MFVASGLKRADVERDGMKLVRKDGRQVLLIAVDGKLFAIANRCPHEGYPLSEGTLGKDCVLTCNWHNWKFDLRNGNALIGRDPVRTYPIEMRGEEIFLELSDPPAALQRERALKGLDAGLADNDFARVAREVARLERAGFDAREAIAHVFDVNNDRHEGGMSHAHAAGADWLAMADSAPSDDTRLAALLEPVMHLAWDIAGVGTFPYTLQVERWDARAFLGAMEAEDEERVIAHIRGAIADRIPYTALRPALGEAALAHYADFGHSAIYAVKAGQFIERLGENVREAVLLAHARQLVQARREERLPEFRFYGRALEGWSKERDTAISAASFEGANVERALRLLLDSSGRNPRELFDAVLGGAGWNMLHFDRAFDAATDNTIADNVGWLDFTHAITFANAARHLCSDRPDLWPQALLQLALFVGRNAGYVDAKLSTREWEVNDPEGFVAREKTKLYDHGIVEPIVACHRLKVLFALEDELAAAPDAPWVETVCAAVNRYLNTPMKRHHGLRQAAQARDFIAREG
jgi:nitrite reductase/ring-hydroxylating ferredoxin subunit